jgi:methyl-accepting chemotaxis protein
MFKNMKISLRLGLSFSFILVFMIVIIFVSLNQIKTSKEMYVRVIEVNAVRIQLANTMINQIREVSISLSNTLLLKDNTKTQEMKNQIDSIRNQYDKSFKELEGLTLMDDTMSSEIIAKIRSYEGITRRLHNEVFDLSIAGRHDEAVTLMNKQASAAQRVWINDIDELITHNEDRSQMRYTEAGKAQDAARLFMFILGIVAISLAIIISIFLTQSITRPLKISVQAADMIASGDLTVDLTSAEKRGDELGLLLLAFSKMVENLSRSVKDINEGVSMLGSSASEILAATTQVASGTAETASAISETTTTVEEVQQAAKLSAQKAKNVADSAQKLAQVSQNGQIAVDESVKGMNRIREQMNSIAQIVVRLSEQSQSIGGIIASVTDIADQSNLLAVNAAIEAAKAGEQGKGFAVVAREIKNLAEQSKQSTSQVRNILNDIQKVTSAAVMATEQGSNAVEAGVKQSAQAGDAIRILTESSNEAAQAATQIVASSQQQVVGMDQIGVAMQNINQAGTETAASMLQSEEAAKNLHELGQKLKDLVDKFKV